MDKAPVPTLSNILAGTPTNEPGVVYFYRAGGLNNVYLEITNRETLDAVREGQGLQLRKFYTFSADHLAQLANRPVTTVLTAAAKLAELEQRTADVAGNLLALRDQIGQTIADYAAEHMNPGGQVGIDWCSANDIDPLADRIIALLPGAAVSAATKPTADLSIEGVDFHNLLRACVIHSEDYPTRSARLIDYIKQWGASLLATKPAAALADRILASVTKEMRAAGLAEANRRDCDADSSDVEMIFNAMLGAAPAASTIGAAQTADQADTQRLNFLGGPAVVSMHQYEPSDGEAYIAIDLDFSGSPTVRGSTVREAIDAAMSKVATQTTEGAK